MILKKVKDYLDKFDSLSKKDFLKSLEKHIFDLHDHHSDSCEEYKILSKNFFNNNQKTNNFDITTIPFLPVDAFKKNKLLSCEEENIFKVLKSSGTTGQIPSSIFLSRENAKNQSIGLSKIFSLFTNFKRPNLIIIDSPELIKDRGSFNARVAGIIGFRSLCRKVIYGLDSEYRVNISKIESFINENEGEDILIFGFTWIIYKYFLTEKLPQSIRKKLSKSLLIHGGGWKKIESLAVNKEAYNNIVKEFIGVEKVISYYGMIEQTGSIFMECEKGYLHTNPLAHVIARSQEDLTICPPLEKGFCQVISCLPTSYPGHSLLTDDIIEIKYENNCPCGRKGTAFIIHGRAKKAEIRGCSDTFKK